MYYQLDMYYWKSKSTICPMQLSPFKLHFGTLKFWLFHIIHQTDCNWLLIYNIKEILLFIKQPY
jgi:hypothetical protein